MTPFHPDFDPEPTYTLAISMANEYCKEGNFEVAEVFLRQLLRCTEHQEGMQLLGLIAHRKGDYQESFKLFSRLVELDPENPDNLNNLALAQSCRGDAQQAIETLKRALANTPQDQLAKRAQYLSNLSIQLRVTGLCKAAEAAIVKALDISGKEDPMIWRNYAALMGETLRIDESIEAYKRVIDLDDDPMAHVDLAYSLFLKGDDIYEAWSQYENRYKTFPQYGFLFRHYDPKNLWDGCDLQDKTIVVYCEQGLGDTIQFVRYIDKFREMFDPKKVILHCNESVVSLLHNSGLGIDEFFTEPVVAPQGMLLVPEHDCHVSLMSLPYHTAINQMGCGNYLTPTHKADLGEKNGLRVGICWAGSPQHPNDSKRSVYLKRFENISKLPGVEMFGLQKDLWPRKYRYSREPVDLMVRGENVKFVSLADFMTDVDRTAALIKEMDLVITVDTAVMHLAAALGVETWGLIPYVPDWRWGLESETTPWYPTLKLVRQEKPGDWDDVFRRVEKALQNRV